MGTWASFRATVEAAVSAAMPAVVRTPTNLDGPTVSWFDDRRPFARHRLLLSIVSTVFNHDRDSALSSGGPQELSSMATIVVQVQAESTHDPSFGPPPAPGVTGSGGDALWLLEQVRLGLRRVSVAEALATAGVAIVGFPGALTARKYQADGRTISAFSLDVAFRATFEFDAAGEGEFAEQIEHLEALGVSPGELLNVAIAVDDPTPDP